MKINLTQYRDPKDAHLKIRKFPDFGEKMDNGKVYFYGYGVPGRGAWVHGDDFNSADDVFCSLEDSGVVNGYDRDGRLSAYRATGLAEYFLLPSGDFDFDGYASCRDFDEDPAAKAAYMELFGRWSSRGFSRSYCGRYDSISDLGTCYLSYALGMYADKMPDELRKFFDFESYGRSIINTGNMVQYGEFFFHSEKVPAHA